MGIRNFTLLIMIFALSVAFFSPADAERMSTSPLLDWTWIRLGGPPGGVGYDIYSDPSDPDIMYVTDAKAGIHKSYDRGKTWHLINEGIDLRQGPSNDAIPVFSMRIDPNNSDILWLGMQDLGGVYRSEDAGETWEKRTQGIEETFGLSVRGFAIEPGNSDVVYFAGEVSSEFWAGEWLIGSGFEMVKGVVYKSKDAGLHWEKIWGGDNLARYILIDPSDTNTIYVSTGIFDRDAANSDWGAHYGGGVGVIKSANGGETWRQINKGLENLYVNSIDFHPEDPQIIIAGAMHVTRPYYNEGGGIYITYNGGEEWDHIAGAEASAVEFADENPNYVYAIGQNEFWRSTDGGINWSQVEYPGDRLWGPEGMIAGIPMDIQVDPDAPLKFFVNSYQGGNFYSADGGDTWTTASVGYTGSTFRDVDIHPTNPAIVYASGRAGPFVSFDGGVNWRGILPPHYNQEGTEIGVAPDDPEHILWGDGDWGCIHESFDGGANWQKRVCHEDELRELLPVLGNESFTHQGSLSFTFAPSNTNKVYAGFGIQNCFNQFDHFNCDAQALKSILISNDGGSTWVTVDDPILTGVSIPEIVIHPEDENIAWAATARIGLLKTEDGGATWLPIGQGIGNHKIITTITVNLSDPDILYAGVMDEALYKSDDGGETWQISSYGMDTNEIVRAIVIDPQRPDVVYAGTLRSGVYVSEDGGATWKQINNGLTTRAVIDLAIGGGGDTLYAATDGGGVFRLSTHDQSYFEALNPAPPPSMEAPIQTVTPALNEINPETSPEVLPKEPSSDILGWKVGLGAGAVPLIVLLLIFFAMKVSRRHR